MIRCGFIRPHFMHTPRLSRRSLLLLDALIERGIHGRLALLFLRKYAQSRIARQIDFYDHEVVFRGKLPAWAATPWLAHRIRQNSPAPPDYLATNQAFATVLGRTRYRPSRVPGRDRARRSSSGTS